MKDSLENQQAAIYSLIARFGEALSSPKRLKIISLLSQGEKSVEQLAAMIGESIASTSAHLKVLRNSRLVSYRKEGRHVWNSLAGDDVARLWATLRDLGEQLQPELREIIQEHFRAPGSYSELSMEEVLRLADKGEIQLLDLREEGEYKQGHLPQAKHIAYKELKKRTAELSPEMPILVYCRGPYCIAAIEGTEQLVRSGLRANRLLFGVPEWRQAGLQVVSQTN